MTGAEEPRVWGIWDCTRDEGTGWWLDTLWGWSLNRSHLERRHEAALRTKRFEVRPVPDEQVAAYPKWAGQLLAALELKRARLLLQQAMDGES